MSNTKKNLGHVTAYAYYKAGGGTMTEEEFTEYMADFGDAAERAVDAASEAATSEANAASSATAAANSASAALTSEENANGAMLSAYSDANRADTAADTATSAKNDAVSAKTAAQSAKTAAETAASTATTKATAAANSATAAAGSATAAANSATEAATTAQGISEHLDQIDENTDAIEGLKEDLNNIVVSGEVPEFLGVSQTVIDNNIFEGTQYEERDINDLHVSYAYYSGVKLTGTVPLNTATYISRGVLVLSAEKKYTIKIKSLKGITYSKMYVRVAGVLQNNNHVLCHVGQDAMTFTPDADSTNAYIALYMYDTAYPDGMNIDDTFYIYLSEGRYSDFEYDKFATNRIVEINDHVAQMVTIPDAVRQTNAFPNVRYRYRETPNLIISAEDYSGVKLKGTIPLNEVTYISRDMLNLSASKTYTIYATSKSGILYSKMYVAIRGVRFGGSDVNTKVFGDPVIFTPDTDTESAFVALYMYDSEYPDGMYIDDTIYVYISEGEYSSDEFTTSNDYIVKQLATLSDAVKKTNIFPKTRYKKLVNGSLIVVPDEYSGMRITGTVPLNTTTYISRGTLELQSGRSYTIYADSKSGKKYEKMYVSIRGITVNGGDLNTKVKNHPVVFTPDVNVSNAFVSLYMYDSAYPDGLPFDDTLYIYISEGEYGVEDYDIIEFNPYNFKETVVTPRLTVGLPILSLSGSMYGISKENTVNLNWQYGDNSGACTLKWQGSSSVSYSKKNFTIKLDSAIDVGWGDQKKYVLKANYIDATNALNICTARLWSEIVADRNTNPAIGISANNGAMDGFPIILMLNGSFYGVYTLTTPKDKWTFGMGDANTEYLVTAEDHTDATKFKSLANLDGSDYELEYAPDDVSLDTVKDSLNRAIGAIINATGGNWQEAVSSYFDVETAIDYMIFSALIGNIDGIDKNFILSSYNGSKWWINAYDLDSVFGNNWMGGNYISSKDLYTSLYGMSLESRLFYLIYTYSKDELVSRYNALRDGILSEDNVSMIFNNFCGIIPQPLIDADNSLWTLKPGTATQTLARVLDWYRLRCDVIDAEIETLT